MNRRLLDQDVQDFLQKHLHDDLHEFLLKKSPFADVTVQELAQQIKGKRIAQKKFPFLLKQGIVFPPQLNVEQSSSEITAEYKARNCSGTSFLDLTAGFGIDAYFISQHFSEITLVEENENLLETVTHNWKILGKKAKFVPHSLEDFLQNNTETFDVIYLDPARRDLNKNKVFLLEDLSPNILKIQEQLLEIGNLVIIKLSPLIDLNYLVKEIHHLQIIEILAVKNDVKEVVLYLSKVKKSPLMCSCINLETDEPIFEVSLEKKSSEEVIYTDAEDYIFIPSNAVLKSGFFKEISSQYHLKKLHPNTHLYTSNRKLSEFPGRVLKVQEIRAKDLKKGEQYNIISKNYPLKPEQIKKKYGIMDGGSQYLIFTVSKKGKIILKSL